MVVAESAASSSWTALRNRTFRAIWFASLPFFQFTLPASAIADIMDRGRLVAIMHIYLAAAAGGLAVLGWFNLLNGYLILLFVFLISVDFAFNAPAFCSLLTDIVSSEELPSLCYGALVS